MTWTLLPATQFAAHAERWANFNEETLASALLRPEFVQPLLTEFGSGKELLVYHERQGQVMAMAIITPRRAGAWDTFQPSQAPIGMWMQRAGTDLQAMLASLMRALPGLPLVIGLTQRDPQLSPRPAEGSGVRTQDYIQTARIKIHGSFEEYWNARGKNLRSNLKKQRSKLVKEGITTRLQVSRAPEEMAAAIADYGILESAGWKAGMGTAIHPDNAQGRFYQSMLEGFCRRGQASVLRYWFDDKIVAMNLCIEGNGSMIVLKTTYDETLSSHYSPAFLMREETCQQLFDEHEFDTLEFYGRVMEWHMRWTDDVRTMYHVTGYRWPFLLQLHALASNRKALLAKLRPQLPAQLPAGQGKPSE